MTIDKEQLISLLIDKTGLEREQVEDQLAELISRIREAADEGKTFEIEGFGTFSMSDGQLQFSPSDILETEINNKYAGMKPIELIGAFKEPKGEEIPDMDQSERDDEDKIWAFDEAAVTEDTPVEEPAAQQRSEADEDDKEPDDEQPQPATADEPATAAGPADIDEDESQEEIVESADSEEQEPEAEQPAEESEQELDKEPVAEPVATEGTSDTPEKSDPIGRFLVAAVLVIAVGIGGWLVYETGLFSGSSQGSGAISSTQGTTNKDVESTAVASQQSVERSNESSSKAPADTSAGSQDGSEPEQDLQVTNNEAGGDAQQPMYGLHGSVNTNVNGYTIVVHSLQAMAKADTRRQNLQEAGFRALVNQASVNGTTYYRVGIGQFESVKAAQQAVSNIPEEYRDNNFIKRIK
jgi:hypothetical protein